MSRNTKSVPDQFLSTISEAIALLDAMPATTPLLPNSQSEPLPSLLDQCHALLERSVLQSREPIRTLHHFACTGGTVISKCLSAMPNVQLLSEVNPLSAQAFASKDRFFPTDLPRLAKQSSRSADTHLLLKIFQSGITTLYQDTLEKGLRLILRDHSHSQFCFGELDTQRPSLRSALSSHYRVCSAVTVRHPIDSYLSIQNNGWMHFSPPSIDEYAVRYLAFLDHFADCTIFKYEDFVAKPDEMLTSLCAALEIPFSTTYRDAFSAYRLSGDSGRAGNTISQRERREIPEHVRQETKKSKNWNELCCRLDYSNTL
tara:strand:+ start:573 stop:1517 length:945 start_codon:yes stop_codon:yes gene_type:complete